MTEVIHFFQIYFPELFGSVDAPPSPLLSKLDPVDTKRRHVVNLQLNKMQKVQSVRLISSAGGPADLDIA